MKKNVLLSRCLPGVLLAASLPIQAMAATSPNFAYTAEQWAKYQDNTLEFDEIAALIHEYNNTVVQNQISYTNSTNKTANDYAQDYYNAANELYSNINYPDSEDSNYASALTSAVNSEIQAKKLTEQGDNNVDDRTTTKLGYDKTEANLTKQAQQLMIQYWSQNATLSNQQETKTLAEAKLQSAQIKLTAGTATSTDVLTAQDSVSTAAANILSTQSNLEQTKQSLILMLGWTYGADVTVEAVPDPDLNAIAAIDVTSDVATGLANNYDIQITNKQLANATISTTTTSLSQTLNTQTTNATNSINNAYQSLLLAKSNYEQALQTFTLEQASMNSANLKLQAGTITRVAYQQEQSAYLTAQNAINTAKLSLLQAQLTYDWNINGLASTQ